MFLDNHNRLTHYSPHMHVGSSVLGVPYGAGYMWE